MTTDSASYLAALHQLLNQSFSLEEIDTLCLQLNVDHESIAGREKPSRIRELLLALGRNGRLPELVTLAQGERPHLTWPPVPADFQLPSRLATGSADVPVNQYHVYGNLEQGDTITVGNISNAQGIAIGRGAKAEVTIQQGMSGDELNQLFAPLLAQVARADVTAVPKVQALKAEVEKGDEADDEKMADLIGEIVDATPAAVEGIVNLFTNSVVAKVAGGATNYVLKRLRK